MTEKIEQKIIDWDEKKEEVTPDVSELLAKYLRANGVEKLTEEIALKKAEEIFAQITNDLVEKKIMLAEYSALGHYFFHHRGKCQENTALFDATLAASELWFYVQKKGELSVQNLLDDINFLLQQYYPESEFILDV